MLTPKETYLKVEASSKKEVTQHIKSLKERGWNYLGITGTGHHKMVWPHAPQHRGAIRFSATPSDSHWLTNSQRDAQTIERNYPAPVIAPTTQKEPSLWDVRLQADQETADAMSRAKQQEDNRPLTVQEKMRLKRQQLYNEKGI